MPVRICVSMLRRIFPFSTSTQCLAAGTNQLRAAARSFTLVPSRFVAFGMLPFACSAFSFAVFVKSAIQSTACALVAARRRDREVGAAEEARHRLARGVARHHELRRDRAVGLADAAAEPARADDRAGLSLRVHVVRGRVRSRPRSPAALEVALKKFLHAVRPATDCFESRFADPLAGVTSWRSTRRSRRRSSSRSTSRCPRCRRARSP